MIFGGFAFFGGGGVLSYDFLSAENRCQIANEIADNINGIRQLWDDSTADVPHDGPAFIVYNTK